MPVLRTWFLSAASSLSHFSLLWCGLFPWGCNPSGQNLLQHAPSTGCNRYVRALAPGASLPPPHSLTLVFPLLFLTLSPPPQLLSSACMAGFALSKICFSSGATGLAEELSCALRWVHWSHQSPAVASTGQPWSLLTDAPAIPLLPTPRHGHPVECQIILKILFIREVMTV